MRVNPMLIPCMAFCTTIVLMQTPWTGLFLTIPFVVATSNKTKDL